MHRCTLSACGEKCVHYELVAADKEGASKKLAGAWLGPGSLSETGCTAKCRSYSHVVREG